MTYTILVFDNQPNQQYAISQVISQRLGYRTITSDTVDYGMGWITSSNSSQPQPDLIIIDLHNHNDGMHKIIRNTKAYRPNLPVIIMTPYGEEEHAASGVAAGATDFLTKPTSVERIRLSIQNVLKIQHMANSIARLERKHSGAVSFSDMVGQGKAFTHALSNAKIAASCNFPVWIEAEPGCGRELMARAIHGSGARAGKAFVTVNCSDLHNDASEAVLFGNVEAMSRIGKFQEAAGGTLYFNEITLLPVHLQQRLLEALLTQEIRPVGSAVAVPYSCRIVCSNSKDTDAALLQGVFSHLVYDRLRKIVLTLPPLRERKQDIAALAKHLLHGFSSSENKFPAELSEDAVAMLQEHPWPGNIRQLGNLLSRAVLLSQQEQLDAATLRLIQQLEPVNYALSQQHRSDMPDFFDRKGQIKKLRSIEEEVIKLALKHSNGCMTKAARNLGIGRSTLYRKIDEIEASGYMPRENQTTRPMIPAVAGELS